MEVIGVGLGRTGTASLRAALEQLGLAPCDHMFEVMEHPERVRLWQRIGAGERPDWAEVFAGYRASVDWPGAVYWRELADAFPQSKVVLTVRDPVRWFESSFSTTFGFPLRRHGFLQRQGYTMVRRFNPRAADVPLMMDRVVWDQVFDGRMFECDDADLRYAVARFNEHIEEVKAYVPADRLLVFDVTQGWEPLCAFLGVPVPDGPFPRINDSAAFKQTIAARARAAFLPIVGVAAALGAVVAAAAGYAVAGGPTPTLIAAAAGALSTVGVFGTVNALMMRTERRRARWVAAAARRAHPVIPDRRPDRSLTR